MAKTSKIFFARAFLVLAFPFWFPRMVFWLIYEFLYCHIREWFPAAFDKNPPLSEIRPADFNHPSPQLSLLQGGRAGETRQDFLLKKPRALNPIGLKLLRYPGSQSTRVSFEPPSARLKK
jgi:hypothetical protein